MTFNCPLTESVCASGMETVAPVPIVSVAPEGTEMPFTVSALPVDMVVLATPRAVLAAVRWPASVTLPVPVNVVPLSARVPLPLTVSGPSIVEVAARQRERAIAHAHGGRCVRGQAEDGVAWARCDRSATGQVDHGGVGGARDDAPLPVIGRVPGAARGCHRGIPLDRREHDPVLQALDQRPTDPGSPSIREAPERQGRQIDRTAAR